MIDDRYPAPRRLLKVTLLALFVTQFLVWPLTGTLDPHLGIAATEFVLLWFIVLYIKRNGLVAADILLLNAVPISTLLITVPTALAGGILVAEFDLQVNALLRLYDWSAPADLQRNIINIQLVRGFLDVPKIAATVALLPGVCEELFFRGFVFTGLYVHSGPKRALWVSAFLFAAAHFNPWQFPALWVTGVLFAALTHWSHSIYPAMLAHCTNNALSVVGINVRTYYGTDVLAQNTPMPIAVLSIAAIVFCAGLLAISRGTRIVPLPTR